MENTLFIKSAKTRIKISAPNNIIKGFKENLSELNRIIPNIEYIDKDKYQFQIRIIESKNSNTITSKDDELCIKISNTRFNYVNFAYTILTSIFSVLNARQGIYLCHGAAIKFGKNAMVLYGIGKSSLAYYLCKLHSCEFICDDNFYLSNVKNRFSILGNSDWLKLSSLSIPNSKIETSSYYLAKNLGLKVIRTATLGKIIYVSPSYCGLRSSKLESHQKYSVITNMVNDRFFNQMRWVECINGQFQSPTIENDFIEKNLFIRSLINHIDVYSISSKDLEENLKGIKNLLEQDR